MGWQRKRIFEDLLRLAKNQLNASGKTNNLALAKWYENASPHIIAGIDFNTRITHLEQMLSGYVSQYGRADTEKAILNILRSFLPQYNNEPANLKPNQLSQTQSTLLLNLLMEKGAKTKAILLTSLYDKLNDFGGDNNFTAAMLLLYNLWDNSVFKLPSYHEYQDFPAPTNLPYKSEKKFGFYQANMTFEFKGATVHVEEQKFEKVYAGKAGMIDKEYYVPFGDYHLYQPVTAFSKKTEGAIPLPNFAMPAFYLKAAADKNKWENVEKGTFLAIDVASLFIGVGMFVRLARTVQVLSKTQKTLALFNAGLQVSSGAVGTMLNFVDENKYPDFCNKLRTVLIVIDLATLGGDFVTSNMLKEASEDVLKNVPEEIRKDKRWAESYLLLNKLAQKTVSSKYIRLYRVQGGKELSNSSKYRFILRENNILIEGEDMIHITFDDKTRLAHFWTKRGKEAEVFTAEIEKSFVEKIRTEAVKQEFAKAFPNRPQIDDPTKTNGSFALPKNYFEELLMSIKNPQIIKNKEL